MQHPPFNSAREGPGDALDARLADVPIDSVTRFVDVVLELQAARGANRPPLWFRGQGHDSPELKPAALRRWFIETAAQQGRCDLPGSTGVPEVELRLNREFRRLGASLLPANASLVDIYFLAQHHGLPTRLLDWTTNPMAVLFFALTNDRQADGIVVVTIPNWRLSATKEAGPAFEQLRSRPFDMRAELVVQTIASLFGEAAPPSPALVLPVFPDLPAGRMLQQGSCFTLHMPGSNEIPEDAVVRFAVPADRKPALESGLRSLGVTWATLFPDLDHLTLEIRSQWGLLPESDGFGKR
jgi:hypothetical protein